MKGTNKAKNPFAPGAIFSGWLDTAGEVSVFFAMATTPVI